MPAAARFQLQMDADDMAVVAKAAALMGTTIADFVRAAAMEKALLLEREARITLSQRDFSAFAQALDSTFAPSAALMRALAQARRRVHRSPGAPNRGHD